MQPIFEAVGYYAFLQHELKCVLFISEIHDAGYIQLNAQVLIICRHPYHMKTPYSQCSAKPTAHKISWAVQFVGSL